MDAVLALEDGLTFKGKSVGFNGEKTGEIVFNTSLTGYQEILTDPSYASQIVVLTYPHIGNYGVNPQDDESGKIFAEGLVVRDMTDFPSNWRQHNSLPEYLKKNGIVAISDIDTRFLVRHIREQGAMRAVIGTGDLDEKSLITKAQKSPKMVGQDLATRVTCKSPYQWQQPSINLFSDFLEGKKEKDGKENKEGIETIKIVAIDFGIKRNILRLLVDHGFEVVVVPANTSSSEILNLKPDGIFLSNGPGDPEPVTYAIATVKELMEKKPILGICLGHQIMGLAVGARTYKLKFGHHGGNHPVIRLDTGQVEITAQNHGFAVDSKSLPEEIQVTHVNLNDQTLEGFRHRSLPFFCVQYHPEAAPGPHDSRYIFDEFRRLIIQHQQ